MQRELQLNKAFLSLLAWIQDDWTSKDEACSCVRSILHGHCASFLVSCPAHYENYHIWGPALDIVC